MISRGLLLLVALAQLITPTLAFRGGFDAATADSFVPVADPNRATPAAYAFAIWGPIFLGALASAVVQALPRWRDDAALGQARPWLIAGYAASIGWMIVVTTPAAWATVPLIVAMLLCLAKALTGLRDANRPEPAIRYGVVAPLGLYVGWVTAATFVNAADVLPGYGLRPPLDGVGLGLAVIAAASLLAAFLARRLQAEPFFLAAVLWALVAIAVRNAGSEPVLVIAPIVAGAALLLVAARAKSGGARV